MFFKGLVGAIFEGVGVSIGSFVGGILMESIGGSATFRLYGTIALIFCFLHVVVQKLMEKYWTRTGKIIINKIITTNKESEVELRSK